MPAGVLNAAPGESGSIEFDPDIRAKRPELETVAMGSVVRVALRLKEAFWSSEWYAKQAGKQDLDTLSFLQSSDEHFPARWTAYPVRAPIIVG